MFFTVININFYWYLVLRPNLSYYNLKILRLKVTKNATNLLKKFCEFPPRAFARIKAVLKNVDEIEHWTFWRKLTRPCCDGLVLGSSRQFQVMADPTQTLSLTEKFTILINKKNILLLLSKFYLNLKYYTQ